MASNNAFQRWLPKASVEMSKAHQLIHQKADDQLIDVSVGFLIISVQVSGCKHPCFSVDFGLGSAVGGEREICTLRLLIQAPLKVKPDGPRAKQRNFMEPRKIICIGSVCAVQSSARRNETPHCLCWAQHLLGFTWEFPKSLVCAYGRWFGRKMASISHVLPGFWWTLAQFPSLFNFSKWLHTHHTPEGIQEAIMRNPTLKDLLLCHSHC